MSDQYQSETTETNATDRGLFDCFQKKEEDAAVADKKKLQRSDSSSSSSSSEEEVEENGVKIKRKKKKGLKDKIKEKLPGHKDGGEAELLETDHNNQHHPAAAAEHAEGVHPEEKKGFLEKMIEKLPGNHKDDTVAPAPAPATAAHPTPAATQCGLDGHCEGSHDGQEKKGFLEKIKEKFPGGNKDAEEVKKDH